jgi:hypothetical protein
VGRADLADAAVEMGPLARDEGPWGATKGPPAPQDRLISLPPQFADHLARPHLLCLHADRRAPFFVPNPLVQNLPDQTTAAVRDRADLRDDLLCRIDAEAGDLGKTLHRIMVGGERSAIC